MTDDDQPGPGPATPPSPGTPPPTPPEPRYGRYAPGVGPHDAAPGPSPAVPPGVPPEPGPAYGQRYGAPAGGTDPGYSPAQPGYGPAQPGYGPAQPGYGPAQPGYGPAGGWTPPAPRPGIVPLRPLGLGELYDGVFRALRVNPGAMLGLPAIASAVSALVSTALAWPMLQWVTGYTTELESTVPGSTWSSTMPGVDASTVWGWGLAVLLGGVVSLVATVVSTGAITIAVGEAVLGRHITLAETWRRVRGRVAGLAGIAILTALPPVLLGLVAVLLTLAASTMSTGLAVLCGLVTSVAALCVSLWWLVRVAFASCVYVLERTTVRTALRRSLRLTLGSWWRAFGILALTVVLAGVVSQLLTFIPTTLAAGLSVSGGQGPAAFAVTAVTSLLVSTLQAVFVGGVTALLYIDTRMRREGLDVALATAAASASTSAPGAGTRPGGW